VTIREATTTDVAVLSELARRTFYDTFAPMNDATDMALYLAEAFGIDQQTRELNDCDITTLLAEEDGEAIAFAQLRSGPVPDCVNGPHPIELWRFYIAHQWHGRGIARPLMDRVLSEARAHGARTLWLGVWEKNARARAFYAKCGFTDVGDHIFLFGTDPQTDLVMAAPL
jgi:GNAT superfamily N-acetyltransferase